MERELRVIIAGSRNFTDYAMLKREVAAIIAAEEGIICRPKELITIISGGAKGADKLGERFAREFGFRLRQFPADWDRYGKKAGYIRNGEMAKYAVSGVCDGMLIAFWDGKSLGTKHMIDLAKYCGLDVHVVHFTERQNTHTKQETQEQIER